jgi:hypothetical protein
LVAAFSPKQSLFMVSIQTKVRDGGTPSAARETRALPNPAFCFRQISLVDFEPDKSFHAAAMSCHG